MRPQAIKTLVEEANITADELMPWATLDHPLEDSYGRRLVFNSGRFEIMVMSWVPGDFSAIHDHGSTQWGAVQCFGAGDHYTYRLKQGYLSALGTAHYSYGMVRAVSNSLIHQMGNTGNEP
ncbi:MAG: cysteine dioxygenase family protein, partial [Cyanobacteria bacterium P01_F01_bin.42]